MQIICTYCSAEKDASVQAIPAIERYKSKRISDANRLAASMDIPLFILSGKFGLIHSQHEIAWYDHLLKADEVDQHVELINKQIRIHAVTEIIFLTRTIQDDPNLKSYHQCIERACEESGIVLSFEYYKV